MTQTVPEVPSGASDPSVGRLARLLTDRLDGLTDLLVSRILDQPGSYVGRGELVDVTDLRRSCHDNLLRVCQTLSADVPLGADQWDAPRATGRLRAQQGVPLDAVLASYRIGGRVLWDGLLDIVRESREIPLETLLQAVSEVWAVVDRHSTTCADAYRDHLDRVRERDSRQTAAVLNGLVSGSYDGSTARAAELLRLPTGGPYLLVVAPLDDTEDARPGPRHRLELAGLPSAWCQRAHEVVGLVAVADRAAVVRLRHALPTITPGRVGVSWTFDRLGQVPEAYNAAVLASRTTTEGEHGVAWLDERLPEALVLRSPELAQRIAETVLGPVLRLPTGERELLIDTVSAYIAHDRSVARCAELLYCHRNTVQNRLNRVEALTGHTLRNGHDALLLGLALTAVRLHPWAP